MHDLSPLPRRKHRYDKGVARPFLKWAGGKTNLLPSLRVRYPQAARTYYDPFLGSGAVAFDVIERIKPERAVLSDRNPELIDTFIAVRDDVSAVTELLREHEARHGHAHYYSVRGQVPATLAERAARVIYLNKTCFNGLYRLNRRGLFNVPIGRMPVGSTPLIVDEPNLLRVSQFLRNVELIAAPFHAVLEPADAGDFVYLDPPYAPLSSTADFADYDALGFSEDDQVHVAAWFRVLVARGCHVVASNHNTPLIRKLYDGVSHDLLRIRRTIAARGTSRAEEVVLYALPSTQRGAILEDRNAA